jgi:hypothetical protein
MDKEAVLKLGIFMKFDSSNLTEQQALDKMEEIALDLQDRYGIEVSIDVEQRYIQELR